MNYCPCCTNPVLLHIRDRQSYWFCRHCWQEVFILQRDFPTLGSSPDINQSHNPLRQNLMRQRSLDWMPQQSSLSA